MFRTLCLVSLIALGCLLSAAAVQAQDGPAPFTVAGLGDCEKITKDGAVPASAHFWDAAGKKLTLHGGRNEMVAAQLILTADQDVRQVNVEIGDLKGPGVIPADPNLQLSLELYHFVEHGSWTWHAPTNRLLPDKKWYPEVLAPFKDPYSAEHKPVGAPFDIRTQNGKNQGVWLDLYIPKAATPGKYQAPIRVTVDSKPVFAATLELTVHSFTLPDETHVDGFGEFYGMAYGFHNISYKKDFDKWWAIASRYHQMAHQHRFIISERVGAGPTLNTPAELELYFKAYTPVLNGSLFTAKENYVGPGENTGPTFFKVPFPEVGIRHFTDAQLQTYTRQLRAFWDGVVKNGWDKKRWCTYMIDEISITPEAVADTKRLQEALDAGSDKHVALMWWNHADPATQVDDPKLDIRGIIRWWVPNGDAINPAFLAARAALGETTAFYHAGQPAIGVHGVNATGVELRTWGTICWRYKIGGSCWWAMDLSDADKPLSRPIYKPEENRWGNGVLFFPGARLADEGLPNIDGPLSGLRMKAYRRGLLDYEYGWLLKQAGKEEVADKIVKRVIPVAGEEATGIIKDYKGGRKSAEAEQRGGPNTGAPTAKKVGPAWSTNVDDWYQMRADLAAELEKH